MSYAPSEVNEIDGIFTEKEFGKPFEFVKGPGDAHGEEIGATHRIFVADVIGWPYRYAKVLKTVAYVAIDEDDEGCAVWEKWDIKKCREYAA
jgi:hypothetical protein